MLRPLGKKVHFLMCCLSRGSVIANIMPCRRNQQHNKKALKISSTEPCALSAMWRHQLGRHPVSGVVCLKVRMNVAGKKKGINKHCKELIYVMDIITQPSSIKWLSKSFKNKRTSLDNFGVISHMNMWPSSLCAPRDARDWRRLNLNLSKNVNQSSSWERAFESQAVW